jgi:C4-dicarboxylate-specific signal transduction histidine kinase
MNAQTIAIEAESRRLLDRLDLDEVLESNTRLAEKVELLENRLRQRDEQRRAMIHIMDDLSKANRRLGNQRKAMLHILADYEKERSHLARQTERMNNSRRALMHILQDSHRSNLRLESSRKAMIHIMGDLRKTTEEIKRREQELRDKQEQLVQAGKLATLGELTTGIAHELNNPLNNIGLFIGNVADQIRMGSADRQRLLAELDRAMQQVRKATEIISHLRTFGRAAPVSREPVQIGQIMDRALSLMQEQLRLRDIEVELEVCEPDPQVMGNAIQLEQVFINLLTNARDAVAEAPQRRIRIACTTEADKVLLRVHDSGPGIPPSMEKRIFDPFFTTKEVGAGTGLGLSITYGIINEHHGAISVRNHPGGGAVFNIELPLASEGEG